MSVDSRLADPILLVLAAKRRLAQRQAAPAWLESEGLAALLEAARSLPTREPFALPSVEESGGLAKLLAEARQWQKEDGHGA
jgi:hypothetical protein